MGRLIITLVMALSVLANASLARHLSSEQLQSVQDEAEDHDNSFHHLPRDGAPPLVKQSPTRVPTPFQQPGCWKE